MSFDTPLNPILITHSHILQTTLLQSTALNFNFLSSYPNPLHYCSPVRAPALWTEPKHMQNSTTFWSRETGTSIWGLFRNTAGGQYTFRIKMTVTSESGNSMLRKCRGLWWLQCTKKCILFKSIYFYIINICKQLQQMKNLNMRSQINTSTFILTSAYIRVSVFRDLFRWSYANWMTKAKLLGYQISYAFYRQDNQMSAI